ncbi:F-box/FBD/LRR-repeat protein At4g00160-like [Trifolium pratense]|uniref:F-box/FBD/LRR-repeat protein At4g00160-like n=1 Tax=Trifolium pratense TaxID=57577 RepID=UPI001E693EBA|nr:F-box/FBD/LRR-repeat protein At4g00160-like [Trifolium pratense]
MEDIISTLPDSIICHILSFLPTKTAATTSILSKRWNPLWLLVLTLNFQLDTTTLKDIDSFRNSVYAAMFSRNITLPILSFRLKCSHSSFNQYDVSRFVYFAMQRGIEKLNISIDINFPPNILSCKMLKVLKLKRIKVRDLSNEVDFPALKILHLKSVLFVRHEWLEKFLAGCPILEELRTHDLHTIPPNPFVRTKPAFKPLLNLTKARIFDDHIISATLVCNVQTLHLDLMEWMRSDKLPMFHNLTYLEFNFRYIYLNNMWEWLLQMLDHCHKLRSFVIKDQILRDEEYVHNWKEPPIVPKCLSSQLRTCCIQGYKGNDIELKFAKYILENSKFIQLLILVHFCPYGKLFIKLNNNAMKQ